MTTSACAANCLTLVMASGFCRSSVRLRLLPLPARGEAAISPFAAERGAAHVLAFAPLHFDDVGAEQRELVARIGASQHLCEVKNLHAFERSGHLCVLLMAILLVLDGVAGVRRLCCRARSLFACRIRFCAAPVLPGSSGRCCCSRASRRHSRSSEAATASWCARRRPAPAVPAPVQVSAPANRYHAACRPNYPTGSR